MLKRAIAAVKNGENPVANGGEGRVNGGGFGPLTDLKPFKVPFVAKEAATGRKRTRKDYSGMDVDNGEGSSDADVESGSDTENTKPARKKKKKTVNLEGFKGIDAKGASLNIDTRKWEFFKARPESIKKKFLIPQMHSKTGELIENKPSNAVLGTRQSIEIPPRPLHDPMGEHSIVLFDPTIDDLEAEREKARIQREQAAMEEVMASQDAANVVIEQAPTPPVDRGPHKSLALMLGIKSRKEAAKVAPKLHVVIDPRLAKVLRPHQVEGVKVSLPPSMTVGS